MVIFTEVLKGPNLVLHSLKPGPHIPLLFLLSGNSDSFRCFRDSKQSLPSRVFLDLPHGLGCSQERFDFFKDLLFFLSIGYCAGSGC